MWSSRPGASGTAGWPTTSSEHPPTSLRRAIETLMSMRAGAEPVSGLRRPRATSAHPERRPGTEMTAVVAPLGAAGAVLLELGWQVHAHRLDCDVGRRHT